jgi:hypothetical protein
LLCRDFLIEVVAVWKLKTVRKLIDGVGSWDLLAACRRSNRAYQRAQRPHIANSIYFFGNQKQLSMAPQQPTSPIITGFSGLLVSWDKTRCSDVSF